MRKISLLFLTFITAMMLLVVADADLLTSGTCGNELTYVLDTDGTLTVSGTGEMDFGTLNEIPWEDYRDSIKKVVLEDGVESIDYGAFSGCVNMSSITVPQSVTEVWSNSFYNTAYYNDASNWIDGVLYVENMLMCDSSDFAGHCTVKDGTRIIANQAFTYSDLASITIPSSVEYIGDSAFSGCEKLESITIPEGVRSLGRHVFYNCDNLVDIKFPDSLSYIGFDAFYGTGLYYNMPDWNDCEIYIGKHLIRAKPSGVTRYTVRQGTRTISPNAFSGFSSVTQIKLPDSVVYIGQEAFSGCISLTEVNIPDGITEIHQETFLSCEALKTVTLPESLHTIGIGSFSRCEALEKINLPSNLKIVENNAFSHCSKLKSVYIPDSVTVLAYEAFAHCYNLESVRLPEEIEGINYGMFRSCQKLTDINIQESVTYIGSNAFYYCSSLKKLVLPKNVKSIGMETFRGCASLVDFYIPSSIEKIAPDAFLQAKIENLHISDIESWCRIDFSYDPDDANPLRYSNNVFINGVKTTDIVIPNSVEASPGSFYRCVPFNSITLPMSQKTVGKTLIGNRDVIDYIVIPSSKTTVEDGALHENIKIYGIAESPAHTYAKTNGNTFIPIEEPMYSVEYDFCGGEGSVEKLEYKFGDTITITSVVAQKEKEVFWGWSTEKNGRPEYKAGDVYTVTDNTILYAIWLPAVYADNITVVKGNRFNVPISIRNNYGVYSMTINIVLPDFIDFVDINDGMALVGFNISVIDTEDGITVEFVGDATDNSNGVFLNLELSIENSVADQDYKVRFMTDIIGYDGSDVQLTEFAMTVSAVEYIAGDADGDGKVDLKDVTSLRRYLAGGYDVSVDNKASDVNCDGDVNLKDVTYLRRALAGGYSETIN